MILPEAAFSCGPPGPALFISPAELLVVSRSAGIQIKSLDVGIVRPGIIFHVQRHLRAKLVDRLGKLRHSRLVFLRIQRSLDLFDQRVDLWIIRPGLVGRTAFLRNHIVFTGDDPYPEAFSGSGKNRRYAPSPSAPRTPDRKYTA